MTISESQYSSNKMSSIHKINDRVVHRDSFDDIKSSSSVNSSLITKRGFKPSDMFDPKKKEFLTNLSYKLFPVSWVSYIFSFRSKLLTGVPQADTLGPVIFGIYEFVVIYLYLFKYNFNI